MKISVVVPILIINSQFFLKHPIHFNLLANVQILFPDRNATSYLINYNTLIEKEILIPFFNHIF